MASQKFQFSAVSQNDPGAADGSNLYCTITKISCGTPEPQPWPVSEPVQLPIPPASGKLPPPTPTWFIDPTGHIGDIVLTAKISCPDDLQYPTTVITLKASDVIKWGEISYGERINQIYNGGIFGIFGFAQIGPNGPIYTVTAGVLNPQP